MHMAGFIKRNVTKCHVMQRHITSTQGLDGYDNPHYMKYYVQTCRVDFDPQALASAFTIRVMLTTNRRSLRRLGFKHMHLTPATGVMVKATLLLLLPLPLPKRMEGH